MQVSPRDIFKHILHLTGNIQRVHLVFWGTNNQEQDFKQIINNLNKLRRLIEQNRPVQCQGLSGSIYATLKREAHSVDRCREVTAHKTSLSPLLFPGVYIDA